VESTGYRGHPDSAIPLPRYGADNEPVKGDFLPGNDVYRRYAIVSEANLTLGSEPSHASLSEVVAGVVTTGGPGGDLTERHHRGSRALTAIWTRSDQGPGIPPAREGGLRRQPPKSFDDLERDPGDLSEPNPR
jgi:hypothetical protein